MKWVRPPFPHGAFGASLQVVYPLLWLEACGYGNCDRPTLAFLTDRTKHGLDYAIQKAVKQGLVIKTKIATPNGMRTYFTVTNAVRNVAKEILNRGKEGK